MKSTFRRVLSGCLALSLCLSGAGAAWYGRDIRRQENGDYVLYEPYSEKNLIETPYRLYELTYIGSADGMAGVHSAEIPYYCAKNGSEFFLWNASGREIVSDSGLRAAGFVSDGGYLAVQDAATGLYGVWSVEQGALTVPCRYQAVRLLNGRYEGTEAAPPETIAAVTDDSGKWTLLRPYDGKTFVSGEYDEVSTTAGLLTVTKGSRTVSYDMRSGTEAAPETAANRSQMSAWAVSEIENAVAEELVPADMQQQYTKACTRREFCRLGSALVRRRTGKTAQQLAVCRGGTNSSFTDTEDADVLACAALGIVNGVGNGKFAPDTPITREQAATMLNRLYSVLGGAKPAENGEVYADDAAFSAWSRDSIYAMRAVGIMQGESGNAFHPAGGYTVEQAIATMQRLNESQK